MPLESNTVVTFGIKVIFISQVLMGLLLSSTDSSRGLDYVFKNAVHVHALPSNYPPGLYHEEIGKKCLRNQFSLSIWQLTWPPRYTFFYANTFPFSCFSSHIPAVYKMKRCLFLSS